MNKRSGLPRGWIGTGIASALLFAGLGPIGQRAHAESASESLPDAPDRLLTLGRVWAKVRFFHPYGSVTSLWLPGGLYVRFTGQEVRHADGRPLQGVGIEPTIVVRPTLSAFRAGYDEVLQRAVAWLASPKEP